MLTIRWTFAGRTILDLTIGDPAPDGYEPDNTGAGYIGDGQPGAFITAPAVTYAGGRPFPVEYRP